MCRWEEHPRTLSRSGDSEKISMNFKAKRSSFSRIFSFFTLDGYGKVVLALGMTTGSSTWTIGGWTSLVVPLGSTVSFVTSASTSTTGETGGGSDLVFHGWRTARKISDHRPVGTTQVTQLCLTAFTASGSWNGIVVLLVEKSRALNPYLSILSNIGNTPDGLDLLEALVLNFSPTLKQWLLLRVHCKMYQVGEATSNPMMVDRLGEDLVNSIPEPHLNDSSNLCPLCHVEELLVLGQELATLCYESQKFVFMLRFQEQTIASSYPLCGSLEAINCHHCSIIAIVTWGFFQQDEEELVVVVDDVVEDDELDSENLKLDNLNPNSLLTSRLALLKYDKRNRKSVPSEMEIKRKPKAYRSVPGSLVPTRLEMEKSKDELMIDVFEFMTRNDFWHINTDI
ncbi:hypothetical protein Tco_0857142 [Tanacetum coccineum]|uniref:Uncharacterized protein n=1 Tax=Tanacetum coccineum TaxID=301880 RepID=A0ABQ5B5I6_9ASTR